MPMEGDTISIKLETVVHSSATSLGKDFGRSPPCALHSCREVWSCGGDLLVSTHSLPG
jgi:hypothetical protein